MLIYFGSNGEHRDGQNASDKAEDTDNFRSNVAGCEDGNRRVIEEEARR